MKQIRKEILWCYGFDNELQLLDTKDYEVNIVSYNMR